MQNLHPLRLQYEAFSSQNPIHGDGEGGGGEGREKRKPVSADNPFLVFQGQVSKQIVGALDSWRELPGSAQRNYLSCRLWLAGASGGRGN